MKYFSLLFLLSSFTFADSAYEKALLSDEQGDFNQTLTYLMEALDNPEGKEIQIRILLGDYLEVLGDSTLIKTNQNILAELILQSEKTQGLKSSIPSESSPQYEWIQTISLDQTYSRVPYGSDSLNLNTLHYAPELEYSIELYRFAQAVNQSWGLTASLEYPLYERSYEYTALSSEDASTTNYAYQSVQTSAPELGTYTVNTSLNYGLFGSKWYTGFGLEIYQSESYDLAPGAHFVLGLGPWKTGNGYWSGSAYIGWQQEFSNFYNLTGKYTHKLFNNQWQLSLSYGIDYVQDQSTPDTSLVYRSYYDSEFNIIEVQDTLETAIIQENKFYQNLKFQLKGQISQNLKFRGSYKYSFGSKIGNDSWYSMNTAHASQTATPDVDKYLTEQVLYFQGQTYYIDGSNYTDYGNLLQLNQANISLQKNRAEFDLYWEFHSGGTLNLGYLLTQESSSVQDDLLINHPEYQISTHAKHYLNLGYQYNF